MYIYLKKFGKQIEKKILPTIDLVVFSFHYHETDSSFKPCLKKSADNHTQTLTTLRARRLLASPCRFKLSMGICMVCKFFCSVLLA